MLFPEIESLIPDHANALTSNVEAHHTFETAIDAAWLYVRQCRAQLPNIDKCPSPVPAPSGESASVNPASYGLNSEQGFDPAALRAQMSKWIEPLIVHLGEEIATVGPGLIGRMSRAQYDATKKGIDRHLQSFDPAWFLISSVGE